MQVFLSIWREFKRQKANLFFTIFFPVILIFILGTLLEQWNSAEYEIPEIKAAYVEKEEYPAFGQFLAQMEKEKMLSVVREENEAEALAKIDDEYAVVFAYEDGKLILHQGTDTVINRAVHIMLEGYVSMEEAVIISYQNGVQVTFAEEEAQSEGYVKAKNLGVERKMMDYYAVCMLVMILFMGGSISSSVCLYEFRLSGLFNRVAVTPANKVKVFLLMVLGNCPMIAIEIGAIMFCSVFFFGAHYCVNFAGNLALVVFFLVLAIAVEAFGAVVGLFIKANPTAVMMPLCWIMMFFSGTFAKDIYIEGVSEWMPVYQIQQAVFDLTLFGKYDRVLQVGAVALVCSLVLLAAGAVLFGCKKER